MDHSYYATMPKPRKKHKYCYVPQCSTIQYQDDVTFHTFPKNVILKKKWEHALKMNITKFTNNINVCSKHFIKDDFLQFKTTNSPFRRVKLKLCAIPSQNLPKRLFERPTPSPLKMKRVQRAERATRRDLIGQEDNLELKISLDSNNTPSTARRKINFPSEHKEVPEEECLCELLPFDDTGVVQNVESSVTSDSDINSFTGLSKIEYLKDIANISNILMSKLQYSIQFSLDTEMRICLTLCKLKLNMSYKSLSVLFGISDTTCKNYFIETINLLFLIFKSMIVWPSKSKIEKNLPSCFTNYKETRVILDCFETTIEKPKCLNCRIRTYSHYKGNHTIKIMVGIAPDGLITFLSSVYGGRASDKFIFIDSGILDKCTEGDAIMVDKGFLIEQECADRGVRLYRPPFLGKNKQLSTKDGIENAEIARARVHIERAIQRIKIFKILQQKVPWSYLPIIDKITTVICGVVNISRPIIGESESGNMVIHA
ncbi:THAP-type domain-containing protein [Aphis craccivora]|uniref:THAP-type domain-containing protein n=1 Tax=Aphis craccivora TaxID=307492 RepID=A0A6G0XWS4_APHCR|nr:THAP-type domain-containing protein [Aphis craccivora]